MAFAPHHRPQDLRCDCGHPGIQERMVQLAKRYGEQIARIMRACFDDPELGFSALKHQAVPGVVRKHLMAARTVEEERSSSAPASTASSPSAEPLDLP